MEPLGLEKTIKAQPISPFILMDFYETFSKCIPITWRVH